MKQNQKQDIESIKARNRRVEIDKAWETSKTRRIIIAILTYIVVVIFLLMIDAPNAWLSALVPALGFFLSTLSMPFFKRMWTRKNFR